MNWFLDLPNLTSITSNGHSFQYTRSVTLSSNISNESWIDIPNLQTVHLYGSFQFVKSKSITSIYMNNNEWIDVSTILDDLVQISNRYEEIDELLVELDEIQANQNEQADEIDEAELEAMLRGL